MVNLKLKRVFALLLAMAMAVSLIGCGKKEKKDDSLVLNYEGKPNVTASSDTKWIDSDIYGMIDENLQISEKDDFYTAVNKDWILEQTKPTNTHDDVTLLMEGADIVKERLLSIVSGEEDPEAFDGTQVNISPEEIKHDQELVVRFVNEAADWDARNKAGVEPLRKYIEDIEDISSIDELTEYITDFEDRNISLEGLVNFQTYAGVVDAENYRCLAIPNEYYVLRDQNSYANINFQGLRDVRLTKDVTKRILSQLGYDNARIDKIIKECFKLEGMLYDHTNHKVSINPSAYADGKTTLEEMEKLTGNYPFEAVYKANGYTDSDDIRVSDKGYFKYLNRVYVPSNLELFKSYYIIHSINANALLLDRELYDMVIDEQEKYEKMIKDNDKGKGDVKEAEIKDDWDLILNKFVMPNISGPINVVYISRYCSEEQKKEIVKMVDDVIDNYHKMIDEEEWMSDTAKAATHEKLDYMTIRSLYPDNITSYADIEFDDEDTLLSMVQKIKAYDARQQGQKANHPVDKHLWNLDSDPTTTINACYKPDENSINIFAGIVAGENVFNVDNPYEVNLARIGTIIGHEVSHAFDSNGCNYDKYGYQNRWWDINDLTTFQLRVSDLSHYYGSISPFPGAKNLVGSNFSGEAIADMGGVKVALMIAREIDDFDYDLFFRSYAQLWRTSRSLGAEKSYAEQDVHPLGYLRTNVTLMQFDEFVNTYDLKEGDGMYCAPEKRIAVW